MLDRWCTLSKGCPITALDFHYESETILLGDAAPRSEAPQLDDLRAAAYSCKTSRSKSQGRAKLDESHVECRRMPFRNGKLLPRPGPEIRSRVERCLRLSLDLH